MQAIQNKPQAMSFFKKAIAYAKQGEYQKAIALAEQVEYPDFADRRDNFILKCETMALEAAPPVVPKIKNTAVATQPDFTIKLIIAFVLLWFWFIPGLIALTVFGNEAEKYPDAPGAQGLLLLKKIVWWLFLASAGFAIFILVITIVGTAVM